MTVLSSIQALRKSIDDTAERCGRKPADISLVIVTKTIEPFRIREAYDAGERDFGENRVQEWRDKIGELPADIRWHLIGHLQTNKVKYVIGQTALIHSLDRPELAVEIEKHARNKGISEVPCLLQVNMSREETKSGCDPEKIGDLMDAVLAASVIRLKGLMTIGPLTGDTEAVRLCFRKTRELFAALQKDYPQHPLNILSMGMSSDYKIAIEEGANMLRIGSLIFPR